MPRVLFVCTGNICRSPFAERYARLKVERAGATEWQFASAGTGALVDDPMDDPMAVELVRLGGDARGFAARQLDYSALEEADWVVTMEEAHRRWLLRQYPARVRTTVTLGRLAAELPGLGADVRGEAALRVVLSSRPAADPGHDVPDPYRRGAAVVRACAERIAENLDVVTRALF